MTSVSKVTSLIFILSTCTFCTSLHGMDNQQLPDHLGLEHKLDILGDTNHSLLSVLQADPFLKLLNALKGDHVDVFKAFLTTTQISMVKINELFHEAVSRNRPAIAQFLMTNYQVKLTKHVVENACDSEDSETMVSLISEHPDYSRCFAEFQQDEQLEHSNR